MIKILLTLFVLFFSSSVVAETIYCIEVASEKNDSIKNLNLNLSNAEKVSIYRIDDKKKEFKWLKSYSTFKSVFHDKRSKEFIYPDVERTKKGIQIIIKEDEEDYFPSENQTVLKFNEKNILIRNDYLSKNKNHLRNYLQLDRVSGILLLHWGIEVNENGEEFIKYEDNIVFNDNFHFDFIVNTSMEVCYKNKRL
jgi:hypothetical protein